LSSDDADRLERSAVAESQETDASGTAVENDLEAARLAAALGQVVTGAMIIDGTNSVTWRRSFSDDVGRDEDVIGSQPIERVHPEDLPLLIELVASARADAALGRATKIRVRHPVEPDRWAWLEARAADHRQDVKIGGVLITFVLLPEPVDGDGVEASHSYRSLAEAAPVGIVVANAIGRIAFCNTVARELLQLGPGLPSLAQLVDATPTASRAALRTWATGVLARNVAGEETWPLAHGDDRWVSVRLVPQTSPAGVSLGWIATIEDVSEFVHSSAALVAALDAAQQANRAKSSFLATMSHELRTPLNSIIGFTRLLRRDGSRSTEGEADYLRRIEESGRRLLALIDEILDLSRIESEEVMLDRKSIDLRVLVDEVVDEHQVHAAAQHTTISVIGADGAPLMTDRDQLHHILSNLIGNAVKFSPGGEVSVDVVVSASKAVRVDVRDTGIGINADRQVDIFEPFHQADGSMSRRFGGSGLGLAIAKSAADALGYRITVASREGHGREFSLHF